MVVAVLEEVAGAAAETRQSAEDAAHRLADRRSRRRRVAPRDRGVPRPRRGLASDTRPHEPTRFRPVKFAVE